MVAQAAPQLAQAETAQLGLFLGVEVVAAELAQTQTAPGGTALLGR
jgi:hypothetical protein